ncbi:LytTR family DNA-binding domain-containing protein [Sporosarcina sp. G11-34]|uniref:LytTR family DNA-binding domain-containing protein n=1 Tax=Sporosarcina sp. G11-34 TaxID=2849605 RepID=UPI0022A9EFDD|nr:LytTR family DNA-binding domain-containing protein [Sporosarcina sp. G11-34]MCZ2258279.1 LytTR family transcriptional regulator DNA-binding domain-containing protein [Sporosarcina sp. G11-34]
MRIIRITIDESEKHDEVEIIIKCPRIDERLARLIKQIKHYEITLTGKREAQTYLLASGELYYFESVDNKSFLYNQKEVYESDLKLYELEQLVEGTHFIRISKNLIVNTTYIESVRALFNGKFEATLTNKEKVIVNRHYVKAFKEKFLT